VTAKQFRALLAKLEMSQRAAARLFRVNERTSRRWASGDLKVRQDVAENLVKLQNGSITKEDIDHAYS
jgi:hypothetical protein